MLDRFFFTKLWVVLFKSNFWVKPRENEGTEREAQGVGRDMLCPRKLFLDERKSLF